MGFASSLLMLGVVPQLLVAAHVLQARQSVSCDFATAANNGDTCASFAAAWGITEAAFAKLNPGVSCPGNLIAGSEYCRYYVCVGVKGGSSPPPTTTKPASSAPTPQMPNTISNCKKFHKVVSGDGCRAIEQAAGISASDFAKWNPYVDAACDNLWLGYYVCIGV
ncbi:hypothetical protein NEUTE2DRAFT_50028 [Neurospora tetrasperma FGSC 2509]|nr:hypothetical protein NEUTE2DRAFT_50028 [Neurospora tetrasperma FGSC 2509]